MRDAVLIKQYGINRLTSSGAFLDLFASYSASSGEIPYLITDFKNSVYATSEREVEKLSHPNFESSVGWTAGAGWTITEGAATFNAASASSLSQTITGVQAGDAFEIEINVTHTKNGSTVTPRLEGATTVAAPAVGLSGQTFVYAVASGSHTTFSLLAAANSSFSVNRISLRKLHFSSLRSRNLTDMVGTQNIRTTLSTVRDRDGVLRYTSHNIIPQSENPAHALWTKTTGVVATSNVVKAPDDTMTGGRIDWTGIAWDSLSTGVGIYLSAAYGNTNGIMLRRGIWVKAGVGGGTIGISGHNNRSTTPIATFTLGTEWQLITQDAIGNSTYDGFCIRKTASSPDVIYIWGAHSYVIDGDMEMQSNRLFDPYSFHEFYNRTSTYAFFGPRIGPNGLHVGVNRSSYVLHSFDFTQTNWAKTSVAVSTVTDIIRPNGTAGNLNLISVTGSDVHAYISQTGVVRNSEWVSISVFVKTETATHLRIAVGGESLWAQWRLSDGVLTRSSAGAWTLVDTLSEPWMNGWTRYTLAVRHSAGASRDVRFYLLDSDATGETPTTSACSAYLWGAQAPTSSTENYGAIWDDTVILTRGSSMNVQPDYLFPTAATISGAGTVVMRSVTGYTRSTGTSFFELDNSLGGASEEYIRLYNSGSTNYNDNYIRVRMKEVSNPVVTFIYGTEHIPWGGTMAVAMAVAPSDLAICLNGSVLTTSGFGAVPATLNRIRISQTSATSFTPLLVESVVAYRHRLPNSELQTLTT